MSRIALVRAPNPSPMTLTGTNSYVIDAAVTHSSSIRDRPWIVTSKRCLPMRAIAV